MTGAAGFEQLGATLVSVREPSHDEQSRDDPAMTTNLWRRTRKRVRLSAWFQFG
jgi:hypothetical protein